MQRKCRLCSRLYSRLKTLYGRLVGKQAYCQTLHAKEFENPDDRVSGISRECPNCECEPYKVSEFSPKPVSDDETLVRFVFHPMHVDKHGNCKPSFFDHVLGRGYSVQREGCTSKSEIYTFVSSFLGGKDTTAWLGYVAANVEHIRELKTTAGDRAFCIYDTANRDNPAHAEVFAARVIEEADPAERRAQLLSIFQKGIVTKCESYRGGEPWNSLTADLRGRTAQARKDIVSRAEKAAKAEQEKLAKLAAKEKGKRPKL